MIQQSFCCSCRDFHYCYLFNILSDVKNFLSVQIEPNNKNVSLTSTTDRLRPSNSRQSNHDPVKVKSRSPSPFNQRKHPATVIGRYRPGLVSTHTPTEKNTNRKKKKRPKVREEESVETYLEWKDQVSDSTDCRILGAATDRLSNVNSALTSKLLLNLMIV